ncbi:MAG: VWA domain-containing protein [Vicinamibacteria bacterium]
MARRRVNVLSLSFLDAMTCGFGAVVLFFMIVNASFGRISGRMTGELQGEVDRLEEEVLEGYQNLVEVKNSLREIEEDRVVTAGLSRRLIETLEEIRVELATYQDSTVAQREHINRLKADLKSLEEDVKRLSAAAPSEETPGDKIRTFVGDGDRQYLTGLKVGGRRILFLVDASASMLASTIVNVVRRRNLPDHIKIRADKWQQTLATVDWLTTQIPRDSRFQIYTFNTAVGSVIPGTDGDWLDGGDRKVLDQAVQQLRGVVPQGGTNLYQALQSIRTLRPAPDNIMLLVDGLPTQGRKPSRRSTISGKDRVKLFNEAVKELRSKVPINVILFPMEGDPMASSAYWKLALATGGSFMSPSRNWP